MNNHVISGIFSELITETKIFRASADEAYSNYRTTGNKEAALSELASIYSRLRDKWETSCRVGLLKEASWYILRPISRNLLDTLRIYREFGLSMSRIEFYSLLHDAADSYVATRALAAISEGYGFRLTVPDVSDYSADIDRVQTLIESLEAYTPEGYAKEAKTLDRQNMDGNEKNACESALDELAALADKWKKPFAPHVTIDENSKG